MNEWIRNNIISIFSILISSGTAVWLAIITYHQNVKISKQKEKHETEMARQKNDFDNEISRLNGNIERFNFIHKTQFDTEFNLYKKIWSKITLIIDVFYSIEQQLAEVFRVESDLPENFELKEKLDNLIKDLIFNSSELSETVSQNRPFYFQELYSLLSIFTIQTDLLRKYISNDDFSNINIEKFHFELEKLVKFSVDIEEIIRNRIDNLKVVG